MRSLLFVGLLVLTRSQASAGPAPISSPPAPALHPGDVPIGSLGFPLGTYLIIEGQRWDGVKAGTRSLMIDTVNGKRLDRPIGISVENVDLPPQTRCRLKGYETARMIGTPPAVVEAAKEAGRDVAPPQAGWQVQLYFVALSNLTPQPGGGVQLPGPIVEPPPVPRMAAPPAGFAPSGRPLQPMLPAPRVVATDQLTLPRGSITVREVNFADEAGNVRFTLKTGYPRMKSYPKLAVFDENGKPVFWFPDRARESPQDVSAVVPLTPAGAGPRLSPQAGIEYALLDGWLYHTAEPGPAERDTGIAWGLANEFVYRTALADDYRLPGSSTSPVGNGCYIVKFTSKHGRGDLAVEVRLDSRTAKLLRPEPSTPPPHPQLVPGTKPSTTDERGIGPPRPF